jgi:hypothetical protein
VPALEKALRLARHAHWFNEAGAAGGREGSSCFVLEMDLGWRGICVEPHQQLFSQLSTTRPNSICENLCLASKQGTVYFVEGQGDTAQPYMSGIRENLLLYKWKGEDVVRTGHPVEKQAAPLASILRKHHAPSVIDYGAFDIEGSELEVLESFPYSEYSFRALSQVRQSSSLTDTARSRIPSIEPSPGSATGSTGDDLTGDFCTG